MLVRFQTYPKEIVRCKDRSNFRRACKKCLIEDLYYKESIVILCGLLLKKPSHFLELIFLFKKS